MIIMTFDKVMDQSVEKYLSKYNPSFQHIRAWNRTDNINKIDFDKFLKAIEEYLAFNKDDLLNKGKVSLEHQNEFVDIKNELQICISHILELFLNIDHDNASFNRESYNIKDISERHSKIQQKINAIDYYQNILEQLKRIAKSLDYDKSSTFNVADQKLSFQRKSLIKLKNELPVKKPSFLRKAALGVPLLGLLLGSVACNNSDNSAATQQTQKNQVVKEQVMEKSQNFLVSEKSNISENSSSERQKTIQETLNLTDKLLKNKDKVKKKDALKLAKMLVQTYNTLIRDETDFPQKESFMEKKRQLIKLMRSLGDESGVVSESNSSEYFDSTIKLKKSYENILNVFNKDVRPHIKSTHQVHVQTRKEFLKLCTNFIQDCNSFKKDENLNAMRTYTQKLVDWVTDQS